VTLKSIGEKVGGVSLDAGWGERNPELVVELQKSQVSDEVASVELYMTNGLVRQNASQLASFMMQKTVINNIC